MIERRIISAAWRALTTRGAEQCRALDRLQSLTDEVTATHIYLSTKPDLPPGFFDQWAQYRLAALLPFREMRG